MISTDCLSSDCWPSSLIPVRCYIDLSTSQFSLHANDLCADSQLTTNLLLSWDVKKINSRNINQARDVLLDSCHIISVSTHHFLLIAAVQLPWDLIHTPYSANPKDFPWGIQLGELNHSTFPSLITRIPSPVEEWTKENVQHTHLKLKFMFTTPVQSHTLFTSIKWNFQAHWNWN